MTSPPKRTRITGGPAALACAACCAVPLFIAAGVLTGATAAILDKTLGAVAALAVWWWHRRRHTVMPACAGGNCGCR